MASGRNGDTARFTSATGGKGRRPDRGHDGITGRHKVTVQYLVPCTEIQPASAERKVRSGDRASGASVVVGLAEKAPERLCMDHCAVYA